MPGKKNQSDTPDTYDDDAKDAKPNRGSERSERLRREAQIAKIPTGGVRAPTDGERVSGSESTRNLKNTLNALSGFSAPRFLDGISKQKFKSGGTVKKMASGGMTSASKRADGIAQRGKTRA